MVGDGKNPDVFFVSDQGVIVTITKDFGLAYREWRRLASRQPLVESALEDRQHGVIADVSPIEDGGKSLHVYDDSGSFLRYKPQFKKSFCNWNYQ